MLKYLQRVKVHLSFLLVLSFSAQLWAIELSTNLSSDTVYSNNVELATTDRRHDTAQTLGLRVDLRESRKLVQFESNLSLEQEYFLNDTYSDRTSIATGVGLLNFSVLDSFIDWHSTFTRVELLSDATEADTPDNRDFRNVYRTGPIFTYNYSETTQFEFSGTYVNVELSDEDDSDSERFEIDAEFSHDLNSLASFSLSHSYEEIIDGDGSEEYTRTLTAVDISRRFSRGVMEASYGRVALSSDIRETENSNYLNLTFRRDQVLWHDLELRYQQDVFDSSVGSDSDESSEGTADSSDGNSALDSSTSDIVDRKRVSFSAQRDIEGFNYSLDFSQSEEDYATALQDEKSQSLRLQVDQQISSALTLDYSYERVATEFIDRPDIGTDRTLTYQVGAEYLISPQISTNAFMQYEIRANVINRVREYEEFSIGFGINWSID